MKDKKKFRKVAIILTIIMILVDVILYKMLEVSVLVEMSETSLVTDLAIMASVFFKFCVWISGIAAIPAIWIVYLLINLLNKVESKYEGTKKTILSVLIAIAIFGILFYFVGIFGLAILFMIF